MENRILPIGSVCSLNGNNKLVMIIGYMPLDFKNGLKCYDYLGVPYPEGMLLPNRLSTFNTEDIESVEYTGYQNEELDRFEESLKHALDSEDEDLDIIKNLQDDINYEGEYAFDNNGTFINESKYPVNNPFRSDITYRENEEQPNESNWSIFEDIQFDENGVVISTVEKEVTEDMEPVKIAESNLDDTFFTSQQQSDLEEETTGYQFDENGTLIAEK